MSKKIAFIASSKDPASLNIKKEFLKKLNLDKRESKELKNPYFINDDFFVYTTDKKQLHLNKLDEVLREVINPYLVVFPSKHSSEEDIETLSVHSPGNLGGTARYGGNEFSLSTSAPYAMKKTLNSLDKLNQERELGYEVTLECTHHGPSEIQVPCFFVEIGSSEEQWKNKKAAKVVAESITKLRKLNRDEETCVSFGGGHYSPRQTRALLETNLFIGHIIPNHHLNNHRVFDEAIEKTPNCRFLYLSGEKTKETSFLEKIKETGLPSYREKRIRRLSPLPFRFWEKIIETKRDAEPIYFGKKPRNLSHELINKEFIDYVQKINRKKLIETIKELELIYFRYENGEISNNFYFPLEELKNKRRFFIEKCIDLISEKHELVLEEKNNVVLLEIFEKRFNPKKANKFGLSEKEFGVLADGEEINKGGNTITPAMVHNINKKQIRVSFHPSKKEIIKT